MRFSKIKKEVIRRLLEDRNWKRLITKFEEERDADMMILPTTAGDTALHLAAYEGREGVVTVLLSLIPANMKPLYIKNKKGNTPLHLAAEIGNHKVCSFIVSIDEKLVDERNNDGETPLFVAASLGKRKAFDVLYDSCKFDECRFLANCSRYDGETVLHSVLKTEQFDLAFQLINKHNEFATWVDRRRLSPLHILATKPSAFRSGSHMSIWQQILYYCIPVDQLIVEPTAPSTHSQVGKNESNSAASFIPFFTNLWERFSILSSLKRMLKKEDVKDEEKDVENEAIEPHESNPAERWSWMMKFRSIIMVPIYMIIRYGDDGIKRLQKEKRRHTYAVQVMEKLIELYVDYSEKAYNEKSDTPTKPETSHHSFVEDWIFEYNEIYDEVHSKQKEISEDEDENCIETWPSPMLLAAKHGVIEMVAGLHKHLPLTIGNTDSNRNNVVLLAAKYRQVEVYKFLLQHKKSIETQFRVSNRNGNTALHLAAHIRGHNKKPWRVTGPALQLQSEIKWYRFVENSMENQLFVQYNNKGKLANKIFNETHQVLLENGQTWLVRTSESCSVLAALITTVAFASSTTIPGGNADNGTSPLERETGFFIFALSSLIALCLSTTSVVAFISILSSKFEKEDFGWRLPVRPLIGLSSLFFSIIAILVSFCAGHYFMLSHRLQNLAVIAYVATSVPIALFFVILQIHLYYDLLVAILSSVPSPN